ncbi:beta-lactamase domain protein [Desulfatibacillum aliphaticivorans]|uniref:Beta-lactamase domain protein n=1 Tax=Desulfatibacillum aliphaticivorans TaxID=218208 RepID=B8FMX3_DESAL|nr:N-acyl homoserine lactonase family protein [Desulfatibacillum aliphaticivorans]ACL05843.1 beta-lactamase domain protein [Desulfatibacillum aliphaticivorans]
MKTYRIKPLLVGWFNMNWGGLIFPFAEGYFEDLPVFMFLIEGEDGEQIIVDGGYTYAPFTMTPIKKPELEVPFVLKKNGIDPDVIKTVVITHLHHDHAGHLRLFRNADYYIQEKELLEANYPLGPVAPGYCKEDWEDLVPRFKLLNGDFPLRDGIDLIHAPGHTAGLQAISVNTSKGRAIIFSDCCYLYAGLAKRFPAQFFELMSKAAASSKEPVDMQNPEVAAALDKVFSGRFGGYFGPNIINPEENMRSMQKLDLLADIVVPGHDPELVRMNVIPDKYDIEEI